jgi:Holliday junction resolvase RusA-like endonuclease
MARAVVTNDNPRTKGWQQLVASQAQEVADGMIFDGAIAVAITFSLPRPVSLPRRVLHHTKAPDLDKLARAVLDGLQGVLFANDAAVVSLAAKKLYAPTGTAPSALVTVTEETELDLPLPLYAEEVRA